MLGLRWPLGPPGLGVRMSLETLGFSDWEWKAAGDDEPEGTVVGYGSVFNNVDQGRDIVLPGAFAGSVASKIKMLWQHDPRQPIGVWDELTEDDKGLRLKGRLALKTRLGAEAHELLKMGAIDGLSIGYAMGRKDFDFSGEGGARRIKSLQLREVSLVTFPMNTRATTVRVKSATCKRDLEQALRDAGLSASEAKYITGLTQLPAVDPDGSPAAPSATPVDGNEAASKAAGLLAALRTLNQTTAARVG